MEILISRVVTLLHDYVEHCISTLLFQLTAKTRTIRSIKLKPKEGYLEKQNKAGRKWQKRYFELEGGRLHYYESKGGKYSDTIRLSSTTPVSIDTSDTRAIEIRTESRVWCLRADSEATASDWLTALKNHCQGISR